MPTPEKKRFYGAVTVSERGQIVIPAEARRDFHIETGDKLLVLGDLEQGIALAKASTFISGMKDLLSMLQSAEDEGETENPKEEK